MDFFCLRKQCLEDCLEVRICALEWEVTHTITTVLPAWINMHMELKKKTKNETELHLHNAIRFISGGRNMRQPLRNSKELFLSPLPHLVIFFGFLLNYIASALRLLIDLGF